MATSNKNKEKRKIAVNFAQLQQDIRKQFQGIDPNDPGQWPLVPRLSAYLALIVLIIIFAWFLVLKDVSAQLDRAKGNEETLKSQYVEKVAKTVHIDELKKIQSDVKGYVSDLEGRLPNKSQIDELIKDISAAGIQNGLEFNSLKPETIIQKEYYWEQPITMVAVSPSYNNVADFAQKLAGLLRIVTLTDITLTPVQAGQGANKDLQVAGDQLKIEATLRTYRYMTPDEQAAEQGQGR